jgi:pSer/pThr/pTyr-binding forkhead associated (FHA) protein
MNLIAAPAPEPVGFPPPASAAGFPSNQPVYPPIYSPPPQYSPPPSPSPGRFVVRATNVSILIPGGKTEIILGRTDPARGIYPDLDLTSHGGESSGVSRQHARLILQGYDVYLEDLNATNFTFLNRQKLQPGQRYLLTPGDEIRLGLLSLEYLPG